MRRHTFAPSSRTLRAFPQPMRRKRQVGDSAAEKALPGGRSRTGRPSNLSRDRLSPNRSKGTSRAVDAGGERTGRVGGLPLPIRCGWKSHIWAGAGTPSVALVLRVRKPSTAPPDPPPGPDGEVAGTTTQQEAPPVEPAAPDVPAEC